MWKCWCLSSCLSQVIPSSVENQPGSSLKTEGLIPSFWKELHEEDGLSAVHPMGKLFLRLLPVCAKSWRLPAEETVQGCQPGCTDPSVGGWCGSRSAALWVSVALAETCRDPGSRCPSEQCPRVCLFYLLPLEAADVSLGLALGLLCCEGGQRFVTGAAAAVWVSNTVIPHFTFLEVPGAGHL